MFRLIRNVPCRLNASASLGFRRTQQVGAVLTMQQGRGMSVLAHDPYHQASPDHWIFPREGHGLNYGVNWSLQTDSVTATGDVFANASLETLLMHAPRGSVGAAPQRTVALDSGATASLCTDEQAGFGVAGVDESDEAREYVRSELGNSPRLFVHDGALGSHRSCEVRVRVVTDCPRTALFFRHALLATPLYDPDWFPRNVLVLQSSRSAPAPAVLEAAQEQAAQGEGKGKGKGGQALPSAVVLSDVDVESWGDPELSAKGEVLATGPASPGALLAAAARCASELAVTPGWRHLGGAPATSQRMLAVSGNDVVPDDWRRYRLDEHADEAPAFSVTSGDVLVGSKGSSLVVGAPWASAASAAAASGAGDAVYAAGAACITAQGVGQAFGVRAVGAAAGAKGKKGKGKKGGKSTDKAAEGSPVPRGAVQWGGVQWASSPEAPLLAAPLAQVVLVGGSGKTDEAALGEAIARSWGHGNVTQQGGAGMGAEALQALVGRIGASGAKVVAAKDVQAAVKAAA